MIDLLVEHPVALIFTVLACGAALGAVRVKGVSLGPAGALFAGLALSAVDERLAIPEVVGSVDVATAWAGHEQNTEADGLRFLDRLALTQAG